MKASDFLGEGWMKKMMENASAGATSSGGIASIAQPFGVNIHRPSIFGYIAPVEKEKPQKTLRKKEKKGKIAK